MQTSTIGVTADMWRTCTEADFDPKRTFTEFQQITSRIPVQPHRIRRSLLSGEASCGNRGSDFALHTSSVDDHHIWPVLGAPARHPASHRSSPVDRYLVKTLLIQICPHHADDLGRNPGGISAVLRSMIRFKAGIYAAAIICFAVSPAVATMQSGSALSAGEPVKNIGLVCDEYGRCWRTGPAYGWDYRYGYRPPTKWERKGFCPPGQAKKGNC